MEIQPAMPATPEEITAALKLRAAILQEMQKYGIGAAEDLDYVAEHPNEVALWEFAQTVSGYGHSARLHRQAKELLHANRFPVRVERDSAQAETVVSGAFRGGCFKSHFEHALAAGAWSGPGNTAVEVEIRVHRVGYVPTRAKDVLVHLQQIGWRPADMAEHAAFAAAFPVVIDEQFEFVALGSHWPLRKKAGSYLVAVSKSPCLLGSHASWDVRAVGEDWQKHWNADWLYDHGAPPEALFLAVVPPGTPPTPLNIS